MVRLGWPKSPKALLEARYKAFADGNVDFIIESCHPDVREKQNREEIADWAKNSVWRGLDIEDAREEGDLGFVKFTCRYEQEGEEVEHREVAEFRKNDGKWYYYDSRKPSTTYQREAPKVGRNDPCSCGSGKKYKKCCGK
jgi:SEC-C motif-containing protein